MFPSAHSWNRDEKAITFYDDGLLEIFIGLVILLFGCCLAADLPWMAAIFPAILAPSFHQAKRTFTGPRLVSVPISETDERKNRRTQLTVSAMLTITIMLGVLVFMGFISNQLPDWLRQAFLTHFELGLGLAGAFLFILFGWILGIKRFYLYAFATALINGGGKISQLEFPLIIAMSGMALLLMGIGVLVNFGRRYPRP